MILPLKVTPDNTQIIGENVAFGLPYALTATSTGIAYRRSMIEEERQKFNINRVLC